MTPQQMDILEFDVHLSVLEEKRKENHTSIASYTRATQMPTTSHLDYIIK